jgi:CheY-like chemotaxis protein
MDKIISERNMTKELRADKIKILIAEDEELIKFDLKKKLSDFGFVVTSAVNSSEDLIKRFYSDKPDLIITDIRFKGTLTGLEAAIFINKIESVPVIFISGYINDEYRERAKVIHSCRFINKPYDDDILFNTISETLKNSRKFRRFNFSFL